MLSGVNLPLLGRSRTGLEGKGRPPCWGQTGGTCFQDEHCSYRTEERAERSTLEERRKQDMEKRVNHVSIFFQIGIGCEYKVGKCNNIVTLLKIDRFLFLRNVPFPFFFFKYKLHCHVKMVQNEAKSFTCR